MLYQRQSRGLARDRRVSVICPACGRQTRHQIFCSAECRRRRESAGLSYPTPKPGKQIAPRASNGFSPDAPPEKPNDFKRLQPGIFGPARVIAAEIFAGRTWCEVISRDGVRSEVAVLRPRALQA
jgi:hypothetical protein